jgi:isopentenyl diphosphate isomerase/L-lactate dehydrogenase-like FMN-dependent dehydrogenase
MLNILKTELTQTMQLTGTTAIEQINRSYLVGHTIPKPNL